MLKDRRRRIGFQVAAELFNRRKEIWEVCHLRNNLPAFGLWEKAIEKHAGGRCTLCGENDDEMSGFTFQKNEL